MKEPGGSSIFPKDPPLRQVQDLDPEAWSQIFDRHYERVYQYAYRRVGDHESAQNIASDSFYRLLVAYQNGNGPREGILPWLYRTAHNLVIDLYRRPAHWELSLEEALVDDHKPLPEETVMLQQENEQVRTALWRLSPDQQQVIALKFMEGLANGEVAKIMQISIGAVKSLQHRALISLARILRAAPAPKGRSPAPHGEEAG